MPPYSEHPAILKARRQAKENMSITQTFVLAHKARSKLSREASKPDHDLRHLVLTANLLDSLMMRLGEAEQASESWFDEATSGADAVESKTVPSLMSIREESLPDWMVDDYSDSESDSDDDEEDDEIPLEMMGGGSYSIHSIPSSPIDRAIHSYAIEVSSDSDSDEDDEDDDEDDGFYSLKRMPSRAPSLIEDVSDSDEDDSQPPSPRSSYVAPVLTEKQRQSLVTTSYYDESADSDSVPYIDSIPQPTNLISAY